MARNYLSPHLYSSLKAGRKASTAFPTYQTSDKTSVNWPSVLIPLTSVTGLLQRPCRQLAHSPPLIPSRVLWPRQPPLPPLTPDVTQQALLRDPRACWPFANSPVLLCLQLCDTHRLPISFSLQNTCDWANK